MIPKYKGCNWLVQLIGRNAVLMVLENVVVCGWATD
jgi:hypothetical protein